MTKINYRTEYKAAKHQISELQTQIATLRDRLDVLRKAKNQTILKTEIVNRNIAEPVFGQAPNSNDDVLPVAPTILTRDVALNTDPMKPPTPPPAAPPPTSPTRMQRKRVKDNWSQCKIFTATKVCQVAFVQTCHCEGVNDPDSPVPKAKTPVSLPKIPHPSNHVGVRSAVSTPVPELRTISRMKTMDFISSESHAAEIAALEAAFKAEREKQMSIHSREAAALRNTIQSMTSSLKAAVEENVKQTINAPNGASVFHLYAEEKKRMEEQVRHINLENNKLKVKVKKLTQELKDQEEEMEVNEESFKKHYVETWDSQYRSWMTKTEAKMNFLRSSNENMQTFLMKNARHLPFAASEELKIYNEYGEKVSVFQ
ncbi:uncharacterized protein LOC134824880 [Bolinopsis microptera]|uniref:uncharacterized protein LOC134824880 n=1 Tax=Bolinopsis microptera TaxID=2820187 RepID=UPI00307A4256